MLRHILISFSLIIGLNSCAQRTEKSDALSDLKEEAVKPSQLVTPSTDLYSDGKTKLIKTANYRFEVDNVKRSTEAIIQSVKKFPAYVSGSSLHLENPILENKMTIRVQSEYFHDLLQEIDAQATFVNHRDVTTDDVSKDFVDLESRLKTKREVEARYMEILRKKAGTIEELLNAEQQIGSLHEEIEATISRINYLKEQVSYSTINLEFYQTITQEVATTTGPSTAERLKEGLDAGWRGVLVAIIAIAYLWPLVILCAAVYFVWRIRKYQVR